MRIFFLYAHRDKIDNSSQLTEKEEAKKKKRKKIVNVPEERKLAHDCAESCLRAAINCPICRVVITPGGLRGRARAIPRNSAVRFITASTRPQRCRAEHRSTVIYSERNCRPSNQTPAAIGVPRENREKMCLLK